MKSCLGKGFIYTPVKDQGPNYLREKFEQIRKLQETPKPQSNVQQIGKTAHGQR